MYAGHVAVALALKAQFPRTPSWALAVGVGVLDILDGVFVVAGIHRISRAPGSVLGISLDYIDWDHSLLMALVWSAVFGAFFLRHSRTAALAAGLAVFSHFVTDAMVHDGDLALWPGSDTHLGTFMWQRYPVGSWFFELGVVAAFAAFAIVRSGKNGVPARAWRWPIAIVGILWISFAPPISALPVAARLFDGTALDWAYAIIVIVGFLVPGLLLARRLPEPKWA